MDLGMIGLGRMGGNMAERLLHGGHRVVGYARRPEGLERLLRLGLGAEGVTALPALIEKLRPPRVVWLMIPSGEPVDQMLAVLTPLLAKADVVVDGGNSYYRDSMRRAAMVAERGLRYVDVGTSGGIWGLTEGYSMMVGGEAGAVALLRPLFETLAPGKDRGWGHVGPSGAGHFVKMIHNGIEYGMMQAMAEGFAIMQRKEAFHFDLHQIAEIWRYGSVVRSWLLDLLAEGLARDPGLASVRGYAEDSGEGRWAVEEAIANAVPVPAISAALYARFASRQEDSPAMKAIATSSSFCWP